ncbi:MAG: hypothetical protein WC551_09825 [Patescibacteria group bacterium]
MEELKDLKVVMTQRGGKVSVGVHAEKCDPVVTIIPGTLEEAIPRVVDVIAAARAQWEGNPLYPKSEREAPKPPVRTPAPAKPAAAKAPPPKKKEDSLQKSLF